MSRIHSLEAAAPHLQGKAPDGALFLLSFAFVLLVALVAQLTFVEWRRWFPGAESERSLLGAVRAGVYTFMSHLS